jgi:hypothetical protein
LELVSFELAGVSAGRSVLALGSRTICSPPPMSNDRLLFETGRLPRPKQFTLRLVVRWQI